MVDRRYLVNEVVLNNEAVKKLIQNIASEYQSPATTTRRSTPKRPDVFILHRKGTSLLSCFSSDEKREDVTPDPAGPGHWYSAARLDNKIYITGGCNMSKSTLVMSLLYDISNKT